MDFIVNNYVWFIVGGVIVLMAIIGYIADKTDFGRKGKENKVIEEQPKKEKREKKEQQEKIKVEAKGINELTQEASHNQKIDIATDSTKTLNISDPIENNNVNNENIDQSLFAPLTDNTSESIPQKNDTIENIELKNVEPAKLENNSQTSEDDDIWKF